MVLSGSPERCRSEGTDPPRRGARGKRVLVNFVGPVFEFFEVAVTAAADIDPPEYATPAKGSAKP